MIQRIFRYLFTAAILAGTAVITAVNADVRIGFLGGFTGPIESLTPSIFEGAKLAATHINDQGGLLGGQRFNMPDADTGCENVTVASKAAEHLINEEEVIAIVGALCSGATISAANAAAIPANVLMVSPASTSPVLSGLDDNDLVFRTAPSDAYQAGVLAHLLISKGIKKIAVSYVNNDYGTGFAKAFNGAYSAAGGTVAASEAHEDGRADYRAEIESLASSGAITLVVLAYADGSGQTILRQAIEGGDFANFVGGNGMVSDVLVDAIGAGKLRYMIATRPAVPEVAGADVYSELAQAADFDPDDVFAAKSYDAAFLIALAVEKKGDTDRAGLSAALRSVATAPGEIVLPGEWEKAVALLSDGKEINYEGASGSHEFDRVGDVPDVIVEMGVRGGKFVELGTLQ